MICNTIGLTSDSFEMLYVHGGAEVPEVYGSINYAQPIFYSLKTLTGATSYSFMGYSEPLKSYEISGNMVQSSTPTPTSPIYPQECGDIWNHWNRMLVRYHLGKVPTENSVSALGNGAMFQIEATPNVNYTVEQDSSPSTSILRIYRSNSPLVESSSSERIQYIRYDSMVEWGGTGTPKVTINSGSFKYIWIQFGGAWYDSYGASATISLVGDYAVPLTVDSENLFDINDVTLDYRYDDDGNWVNDVGVLSSNIMAFPQNSDYIYSFKTTAEKKKGICRINFLDENRAWIGVNKVNFDVAAGATVSISGKTPPNTRYIRTSQSNGYVNIKLIQSDTASLYLSEPLRKIGDYADSINSDGTVTRRIRKLVLTGKESWDFYSDSASTYGAWQFFFGNMIGGLQYSSAMSNIAGYGVKVETRSKYPYGVYLVVGGTKVAFQMAGAKDTFTNIASWKKYLAAQYAAGTPVTVWYVLAEPTTEQVTAPTITPATGNNTLAIGTTLQPSSVSITGHVKPSS